MKRKGIFLFLYFLILFLTGCSGLGETSAADESSNNLLTDIPALYSTVTQIEVQVFYEPDALPYTGTTQKGMPYWNILEANIAELFSSRKIIPNVYVPRELDEMSQLPEQGKSSWTSAEIMDLAQTSVSEYSDSGKAMFYIFYVNGYLSENGSIDKSVIGVSLSTTSVVVIFKDVVVSTGGTTILANFLEQATLVHEFGHAIGLVNNGVPLASAHHDSKNGHHCTNPDCVMYWLNEGLYDMKEFVNNYIENNTIVMFGQECLNDTAQYKP